MTGIIVQPAGLGDIFFLQKVAKTLLHNKTVNRIIWPIIDQFDYIRHYIHIDGVKFCKRSELNDFQRFISHSNHPGIVKIQDVTTKEECIVIPLQAADRIFKNDYTSIMDVKYRLAGIDGSDWVTYFDYKRNYTREARLKNHLKIEDGDRYVVVSNSYGSPPGNIYRPLKYTGDKRVVNIKQIDGFNVFDWCGVIEDANELHIVESCWIYIVEKLNLQAEVLNLYSRFDPANFTHIRHIPTNVKWEFREW